MNKYTAAQAIRLTVPVFFGYLAIGIPFGLMLVDAGFQWWLAPVMSLTMYAGAGQYAAVGLFAAGAGLPAVIVTMLAVNIRHIVYGLSLITPFKNAGKWKPYLIFALTDETYALLTGCTVPQGANTGAFFALMAGLNQLYWILGGLLGAVAGTLLPFSFKGVDFALTALFTVLLIDRLKQTADLVPPMVGLGCALIAVFLFGPDNMLIAALALGIGVLALIKGKPCRK